MGHEYTQQKTPQNYRAHRVQLTSEGDILIKQVEPNLYNCICFEKFKGFLITEKNITIFPNLLHYWTENTQGDTHENTLG